MHWSELPVQVHLEERVAEVDGSVAPVPLVEDGVARRADGLAPFGAPEGVQHPVRRSEQHEVPVRKGIWVPARRHQQVVALSQKVDFRRQVPEQHVGVREADPRVPRADLGEEHGPHGLEIADLVLDVSDLDISYV